MDNLAVDAQSGLPATKEGWNMKILLLVITLLIVTTGESIAGYWTGNKILEICGSADPKDQSYCRFYLAGTWDTYDSFFPHGSKGGVICLTEGISINQLRRVFLKFANANPEILHYSAGGLALAAFTKAFPCE